MSFDFFNLQYLKWKFQTVAVAALDEFLNMLSLLLIRYLYQTNLLVAGKNSLFAKRD